MPYSEYCKMTKQLQVDRPLNMPYSALLQDDKTTSSRQATKYAVQCGVVRRNNKHK